jgi:hypothetical protein
MADGNGETTMGEVPDSRDDSRVKAAAGDVKDKAKEMKDQASDHVGDLATDAKEKGRELAREGKARARSQADEQKDRVSDGLRSMAGALRRGGQELPEDQRQYGRFLGVVADRAEDASHYLEDHDVEALTREVRTFARQHTPVFLGGAFTLGMLGARFLKSSPRDTQYESGSSRDLGTASGSQAGGYGRPSRGEQLGSGPMGSRGVARGPEGFESPGDYEIDEPTPDSLRGDGGYV